MIVIVTSGMERAGHAVKNLPATIAHNKSNIVIGAISGVLSVSILALWIELAVACTAFWLATFCVGLIEKKFPNSPNLVKITVGVAAGAIGVFICEFVAEIAIIAIFMLSFETLKFFWEAYNNEREKSRLSEALQVLPEVVEA